MHPYSGTSSLAKVRTASPPAELAGCSVCRAGKGRGREIGCTRRDAEARNQPPDALPWHRCTALQHCSAAAVLAPPAAGAAVLRSAVKLSLYKVFMSCTPSQGGG